MASKLPVLIVGAAAIECRWPLPVRGAAGGTARRRALDAIVARNLHDG
jgi:hypothetical protein